MIEIPYVNVPNDLSKIKTKLAFNLTKRQLVCFGIAAAVGIPSYLLARSTIGNTGAMFLMMGVALPAFLLAMYEKDGLPAEKYFYRFFLWKFIRPVKRTYKKENRFELKKHREEMEMEGRTLEAKQKQCRKAREGKKPQAGKEQKKVKGSR